MTMIVDTRTNAPWKQRLCGQLFIGARIATSNPDRGMILSDPDGIIQIYAWDLNKSSLSQRTAAGTGHKRGYLSPDGEWIYYHHDQGGNEIGHVHRIPWVGGVPEDLTPELPPYSLFTCTFSDDCRYLIITRADKQGFHIDIRDWDGDSGFVIDKQMVSVGASFSNDNALAAIMTTESSMTTDLGLQIYEMASHTCIADLWDGKGTSNHLLRFSPVIGDNRLLATTNASGYERPFLWNPITGKRFTPEMPELEGDITPLDWSSDGRHILCIALERAVYHLYLIDLHTNKTTEIPYGGGSIGSAQFRRDNIVLQINDSEHPRCIIETKYSGTAMMTLLSGRSVPPSTRLRSVNFVGAQGDNVQAWLATPDGTGPFPTIIHTHGGPRKVMTDQYSPVAQAWVDHKFAFLSINYHGSTTFGAQFMDSINQRLGELEVLDIQAGVKWAIDNQVADPSLVFATGGSYGGYLTLLSLGRLGREFAGGLAHIAIADWTLLYEDDTDVLRGFQRAIFGGTPKEKPEEYRKASPITYVNGIKAPMLVIQGRNDSRCLSRQMEVYEKCAKEAGKSIHVEWFEAGHGSVKIEDRIRHQQMMMQFAVDIVNRVRVRG